MSHRLGFAVKVLGGGGLPSHDTRRWQSGPHLRVSLERLARVFEYLRTEDIRMYRMSSDLVPYGSHPEMPQFHGQVESCEAQLAELGSRARAAELRLSFHPGQYVVLNSERPEVRQSAATELDLHAAVLDAMGLGPEAVVVLHVGSGAGGTRAALDRFLAEFERLSDRARARLAIENDDRRFGLRDVLWISERTGTPVVWDSLHHRCHDPDRIPPVEALELALASWPRDVVPKIHFSSARNAAGERRVKKGRRLERRVVIPPLRAHADLVDPVAFEALLELAPDRPFDVMLEAKAKDLALLRLREQLLETGYEWAEGRLTASGR